MKPSAETVHKMLFITLSNLGDVVLTLPVAQSLKRAFPKATLDVISGAGGAPVFEGDPRIRRYMLYDKRASWKDKWQLLNTIRNERYDVIVDLRKSLLGFLGGAPYRNAYFTVPKSRLHRRIFHGWALKGIAPLVTEGSFIKISAKEELEVGRLLDETAIGPTDPARGSQPLVVAAVGSKSDLKIWPAAYYVQLLERLAVNDGCRIVFAGDVLDAEATRKVRLLLQVPSTDLTGQTDFKRLCALINKASLVVTNDSAPLHIADALKIPVLSFFGPTSPEKYGPLNGGSRALSRSVFCAPCEKAQCRFDRECMKELWPDEAYRAARALLHDDVRHQKPKVLVVRLDRIGDAVLSFPSIAAIREHFPEALISVMCRPSTRDIFESHPDVDEVIPYAYEKKGRHRLLLGNGRFLIEIFRRGFDVAFILNPSLRSYLVPFVTGIPYRVGFKTRWTPLLTKGITDRRREGKKHEAEYTLEVVRAFTGQTGAWSPPRWPILPQAKKSLDAILATYGISADERILALHMHASCVSKRWPAERFADFVRRFLAAHPSYRIAVVGAKEATASAAFLCKACERAMDLTGKLSLKDLATFLERCEFLVSNDSGPVHIAAAVGTPVVAIFGRNQAGLSPVRWRPLGGPHQVLQHEVGCPACLAHECRMDFKCLKAVTAEEVLLAAERILLEAHASKVPTNFS